MPVTLCCIRRPSTGPRTSEKCQLLYTWVCHQTAEEAAVSIMVEEEEKDKVAYGVRTDERCASAQPRAHAYVSRSMFESVVEHDEQTLLFSTINILHATFTLLWYKLDLDLRTSCSKCMGNVEYEQLVWRVAFAVAKPLPIRIPYGEFVFRKRVKQVD